MFSISDHRHEKMTLSQVYIKILQSLQKKKKKEGMCFSKEKGRFSLLSYLVIGLSNWQWLRISPILLDEMRIYSLMLIPWRQKCEIYRIVSMI